MARFVCPACGYLHGLERGESVHGEVRCPNCGTGFVPALLDSPMGESVKRPAADDASADHLRSIRSNVNLLVFILVALLCCGCCGGLVEWLF